MRKYLAEGFSEEKLHSELSDETSAFYFATLGNEVLGYLKLNLGASQTELQDAKAIEIDRIYVLKAFHAKKVGQLLYDHAIQLQRSVRRPMYGSGCGKKIQGQSNSTRKMAFWSLANMSSCWATMRRRIL